MMRLLVVLMAAALFMAVVLAADTHVHAAGDGQDWNGVNRVVPAALWSAIVAAFPEERRLEAVAIARCETGNTFAADALNFDGSDEVDGVFQVKPRYWGAVPADYDGQAQQVAAIVAQSGGWGAWECQP